MYVAQVIIPAKEYEYSESKKEGSDETEMTRTAKDLNMDDVVLKLYAI